MKHERDFLRIVTFGYPELERQIASCEIAEYDVTGWCDVNVLDGAPSPNRMVDGPAIDLMQMRDVTVNIARPDIPAKSFLVSRGKVVETAPIVPVGAPQVYRVEITLWTADDGILQTVEVISVGDGYVVDPYRLFVDVAESEPNRLQYPSNEHRSDPNNR